MKDYILSHALKYLEFGWQPTPVHYAVDDVCSCSRGPNCHTPGKHPVLPGWQNTILDANEVTRIWTENPHYNVGLVTGSRTNLVALDIDAGNGGYESLRELEDENGLLPETTTAQTGGGGKHYLFRYPEGMVIPTKGNIMRGIDVRGEGGQIVAAPSYHSKSRNRYKWVTGCSPATILPVDMPDWLLDMLEKQEPVWLGEQQAAVAPAETYYGGNRNNSLFSLGRRLRVIQDIGDAELGQMLHALNRAKCRPPLAESEVDLLISSVLKKGGSHTIVSKEDGGKPPGAIRFLDTADIWSEVEKPIPYLVPNLLSEGEICLLASPTEAGKSLIAMSLTLSVVAGKPAWGRGEPCRKGRVMYCTEELAGRTIRRRFKKLAKGLGIDPKLINNDNLCIVPQQNLSLALARRENIDALLLKAQEFKPDLVILDTFVSYFGASETEADANRAWFGAVPIALRSLTGCAVIVQHHTRKMSKMQDGNFIRYSDLSDDELNNEIRGSSDLAGVSERIWFIWKKSEEQNDFGPTVCINFRNTKAREGDKHPSIFLVIQDTDEYTTTVRSAMAAKSKKHVDMEHHFREVLKSGEVVPKPSLIERLKVRGVSKTVAYKWIAAFVDQGVLIVNEHGNYSLNGSMSVISF